MKEIDGKEALKEILKIGKQILIAEERIEKLGIFGKNSRIELIPNLDICNIVEKLLKLPPESDENCNDWYSNFIFEYWHGQLTLNETVRKLLEEEE